VPAVHTKVRAQSPSEMTIGAERESPNGEDPRTRTRTRRLIVYVNVYRFAVYVYASELEQEPVRKGQWRSKLGLAIERTRDGIQHEKPGTATVLLRC
jgi:hypothetical protein